MHLGVIADDFTGASDIANTIAKGLGPEGGLATAQYGRVPDQNAAEWVEAGVIAQKTRSIPVTEAVAQSLAALEWLLSQGCAQIVFKYCSTFDSTPQGNIGPVAEALAERLGMRAAIVCPAFPAAGRTIYQGHLFVQDKLLSESGMQHHPLTPMTDPDLRRWLAFQCRGSIGHVAWQDVNRGADAISDVLALREQAGDSLVVVDAVSDRDLIQIGKAAAGQTLVTGGSGVALALPRNLIRKIGGARGRTRATDPRISGPEAVLVGSCSGATLGQVAYHAQRHPTMAIDVEAVMGASFGAADIVSFVSRHEGYMPLAYSSSSSESVKALQERHGREVVAARLDDLFATAARQLIDSGVKRLVVGGGETSGAVVSSLDLGALRVGRELDPGVPLLFSEGKAPISLALKSGNFGSVDFFEKALSSMEGMQ